MCGIRKRRETLSVVATPDFRSRPFTLTRYSEPGVRPASSKRTSCFSSPRAGRSPSVGSVHASAACAPAIKDTAANVITRPARRRLIVKSNPLLGRPDTSRVPKGSPQIHAFYPPAAYPGDLSRGHFAGISRGQREPLLRRMETLAVFETAPMQRAVWETRARYTKVRSAIARAVNLPVARVSATSNVWKRPPEARRR